MTERLDIATRLNRSAELLWRDAEPQPAKGSKPGLTLAGIVDAAIAVADAEGMDALSMRRIARELDSGTMSLYRYVPGKGELLDLMIDRVSDPGTPYGHGEDDWRETLERIARETREVYLKHRWLLHVNWSRPVLGPNTLAGAEIVISGLSNTPFTDRERVTVLSTIDGFVTGLVRQEILYLVAPEETGISDEDFWAAQQPFLEQAMATGDYPTLADLDEDAWAAEAEEVFEFGLARLLDGIEQLIIARRTGDQAGGSQAG